MDINTHTHTQTHREKDTTILFAGGKNINPLISKHEIQSNNDQDKALVRGDC